MFEMIGLIGVMFLGISFIPQLTKTYLKKTVEGVSLKYWLTLLPGFILCLLYSISLNAWPLIISYSWAILCTLTFLALYFKYRRNK